MHGRSSKVENGGDVKGSRPYVMIEPKLETIAAGQIMI
jgi:hypothetical protein